MKKSQLVKALNLCFPGINESGIEEGEDCFDFSPDYISAGTLEFRLHAPLETEIQGQVKAKEFFQVINKMENDIVLKQKGDELQVKDRKTTLTLPIFSEQNGFDLDAEKDWEELPANFLEGLVLGMYTASKDTLYAQLNTIVVNGTQIIATDNHKALNFQLEEDMGQWAIASEIVRKLVKVNISHYILEEKELHLKNEEGAIISVQLLEDEPFDSEKVLNLFQEGEAEYQFPTNTVNALDLADILSYEGDDGDFVKIKRKGDYLIFEGERETGKVRTKVKINTNFPDEFSIQIASPFLRGSLKHTTDFWLKDSFLFFQSDNFDLIVSTI